MFNDMVVVQSAVSSFNNAALAGPAFFWTGILMLPLLALVWLCRDAIVNRLGWNAAKINARMATITMAMILVWLEVKGGHNGVVRDAASTLPYVMATVIFVTAATITRQMRGVSIPKLTWPHSARGKKIWTIGAALAIVAAVALSGWPTWWGTLMQGAAFVCGFIVGRMMRPSFAPLSIASVIMITVTTAMLMQPEYFRFGQLGNLTVAHLGWLVLTGAAAVATLALRNIPARGRIHNSAFVKLKWMMRFVACFALVLFALTESVPVFAGLMGTLFVMYALSIWHAARVPNGVADKIWAVALMTFGALTVMPVIAALGVLIWPRDGLGRTWADSKFLL